MTGQLIYKPKGVSLTKEKLESCVKNNKDYICVAFSYKKNDTTYWDNCQFEKLKDLEADGIFEKVLDAKGECVIYFHGSFNPKVADLPFYTVQNKRDWFWYAMEGVCPIFQTSYEGECLHSNFLSSISPSGAYNLWSKLGSSSKLARTIGIKQGVVSKFGHWYEEEGIFYSNQDHKKVPYTYTQHPPYNVNANKPKETIGLKYPETHKIDEGFVMGKSGDGLLHYYNIYTTNPNINYIDDVTALKYKDLGFKPLDFIRSITKGTSTYPTPSFETIKDFFNSGEEITVSIIRFVDCDKKNRLNLDIKIPGKEVSNVQRQTLLPDQKRFMLHNLNVRIVMTENDTDEANALELIKTGLGDNSLKELESMSDFQLISRATELGIKGWQYIKS